MAEAEKQSKYKCLHRETPQLIVAPTAPGPAAQRISLTMYVM